MSSVDEINARPRLLHRAILASSWTLAGYAAGQALRFGSNLILTRLLFPEAFGTMALVQAVLTGVTMLSDLGTEQAIIQHKGGEEPNFVNTAWTIQVIRGAGIWLLCCALAVPIAAFYRNSELYFLLPAVGLTALINGFTSSSIAILNRKLGVGRITILEIASSVVSISTMVFLAWILRSVWALVIGNIVGSAFKVAASHLWLSGSPNSFLLDPACTAKIRRFGSWILVSTALTFLVGEGNRLVIASFVDLRDLAFYSLASSLTLMPLQIVQQIGSRVLLPAYSEVVRERPESIRRTISRARVVQIVLMMTISAFFIFFGKQLISALYDPRYEPVAQMLGLIALGLLPQSITVSYGPVLIAQGLLKQSTYLLAVQLSIQLLAMIVGGHFGGVIGLILGLSLSQWMLYPFHAYAYSLISVWQPKVDGLFGVVAGLISYMAVRLYFHSGAG
jgi:O-antigen/teichoic acid export membrane protein